MRYLLIALMIVLLPLRGWAGNAMAVDMAANMAVQQVSVAQISSASAASTAVMTAESAMPADCPMHLQAMGDKAVDGKAEHAGTAQGHCHSCDTCQLCLAMASWAHTTWPAGTVSRPGAPLLAGHDFRSAETAASFKPPIS